MKVFKLNDYEWWAGPDLESVKEHYLVETGLLEEEAFDDPYELSDEDLERIRFIDEDISFAEHLKALEEGEQRFPCGFAASE